MLVHNATVKINEEYAQKENFLEMRFEQAFIARVTSVTDTAAKDLATKRAALQMRLVQVTSAARHRLEAGLAVSDLALRQAEGHLAAEHYRELLQVVSAQRRAFKELDDVRAKEAAIQWQALHQQE